MRRGKISNRGMRYGHKQQSTCHMGPLPSTPPEQLVNLRKALMGVALPCLPWPSHPSLQCLRMWGHSLPDQRVRLVKLNVPTLCGRGSRGGGAAPIIALSIIVLAGAQGSASDQWVDSWPRPASDHTQPDSSGRPAPRPSLYSRAALDPVTLLISPSSAQSQWDPPTQPTGRADGGPADGSTNWRRPMWSHRPQSALLILAYWFLRLNEEAVDNPQKGTVLDWSWFIVLAIQCLYRGIR